MASVSVNDVETLGQSGAIDHWMDATVFMLKGLYSEIHYLQMI